MQVTRPFQYINVQFFRGYGKGFFFFFFFEKRKHIENRMQNLLIIHLFKFYIHLIFR
jgi:hypothetical protein